MTFSAERRRARALALALVLVAVAVAAAAARSLIGSGNAAGPESLWQATLLTALVIACMWTAVVALLAYREIGRPGSGCQPARLVATTLLALAGAAVASSATPALAVTSPMTRVVTPARTVPAGPAAPAVPSPDFADVATHSFVPQQCSVPEPGWTPTTPRAIAPADRSRLLMPCHTDALRSDAEPTQVVVRRGDSLWTIVARSLGPDATASQVARAVPVWHHANRTVIGSDPNLLFAGQLLHAPTTSATDQGNPQ